MKKPFIIVTIFALFACLTLQAQELIIVKSANLKCDDSIRVYSPQDINKSNQIPTLFLLHGWSGDYKNWGDKYDLQAISNKTGFRIITPDGFYNSWYINNTNPNKMQWRTFFNTELLPLIKEKYKLNPNTTFITGLSMGGHGAINLFIDNPNSFRSAGSMSGVLDLQLTSLKDTEIVKVIGDRTERIDSESAINRINQLINLNKPIIVTCGYDDVYSKCTEAFSAKCREKGIQHIIILSPGKHSWQYWGFALDEHISFFKRLINNDNLGY
ncbi:MAG: alpha/beta hydrolase family protein [Bacteroidales bacterium]